MLNLLHIENVAVIEKAELEFEPGLNVLTGETGAGKSIIIDSINAILGERVGKGLVRTGAASAVITAEFSSDSLPQTWFEENDIEYEAGESLVVMRKISADGKSSGRINGMPVSTACMRELGDMLIDVHGQNDGRRLLNEASHRAYLDGFGALGGALAEYKKHYEAYKTLKAALNELREHENDKERLADELRGKIAEIEELDPRADEYDELKANCELMRNSEKISEFIDRAYYAMYGGDNTDGALALLSEADAELESAVRYTDRLDELAKTLRDLRYGAEDVTDSLMRFRESLDFSVSELDRAETRLNRLEKLIKKYGSLEAVPELLKKMKNDLEDVEYLSENIEKRENELDAKRASLKKEAAAISAKRAKCASELEKRIVKELSELNMPKVSFRVEISPLGGEDGFDSTGCDAVRFLMSANAGEELGRISKIASGGELSRIMLAMKTVLSDSEATETLIFDEIDTGVSGKAAQSVAEKLAVLSRGKQVLCVTHLPQLAVMADAGFLIEKSESEGRTFTSARKLDDEGRKNEIARITGGANITETLLESAAEQLAAARKFKEGLKSL